MLIETVRIGLGKEGKNNPKTLIRKIHVPMNNWKRDLRSKRCHKRFLTFLLIFLQEKGDLKDMMLKVFREGLEGLVLKDVNVIQYYFVLNIVIRYYSGSVLWQSYDIRFIQVTNVKLDDQGLNVATFLSCIELF